MNCDLKKYVKRWLWPVFRYFEGNEENNKILASRQLVSWPRFEQEPCKIHSRIVSYSTIEFYCNSVLHYLNLMHTDQLDVMFVSCTVERMLVSSVQ
jgi:hypothetical protein